MTHHVHHWSLGNSLVSFVRSYLKKGMKLEPLEGAAVTGKAIQTTNGGGLRWLMVLDVGWLSGTVSGEGPPEIQPVVCGRRCCFRTSNWSISQCPENSGNWMLKDNPRHLRWNLQFHTDLLPSKQRLILPFWKDGSDVVSSDQYTYDYIYLLGPLQVLRLSSATRSQASPETTSLVHRYPMRWSRQWKSQFDRIDERSLRSPTGFYKQQSVAIVNHCK